MRSISMAVATEQFLAGTKTVTRRVGWMHARPGMLLRVVKQIRGFKPGDHAEVIGYIQLTDVRNERLDRMITDEAYGRIEAALEGFPGWTGAEFVRMFGRIVKPLPDFVRRLEFEKVEAR